MPKITNAALDSFKGKVEYQEHITGKATLVFENVQTLQDFIHHVRKQGIAYGIEMEKLKLQQACVPIGEVRDVNRRF